MSARVTGLVWLAIPGDGSVRYPRLAPIRPWIGRLVEAASKFFALDVDASLERADHCRVTDERLIGHAGGTASIFKSAMAPGQHPLVGQLCDLISRERWQPVFLYREAGVGYGTITHWRSGMTPNLANFDAILNAMGYELCIRRRA